MSLAGNKYGWRDERFIMSLTGFLLGLFLVFVGALIIYFAGGIRWTDFHFSPGVLFLGCAIMLVAAFLEELIFRMLILGKLLKLTNRWLALVISSILFAMVHLANPRYQHVRNCKCFFRWNGFWFNVYVYTKFMDGDIFFHFSWNFFQGPVLGFPVSGLPFESMLTVELDGNSLLTGGSFRFEASATCSLLLITTFYTGFLCGRAEELEATSSFSKITFRWGIASVSNISGII